MTKKTIVMSTIFLISPIFAMESDLDLQGNTLTLYVVCRRYLDYESISFLARTNRENNRLIQYISKQNNNLLPTFPRECQGSELRLAYNRGCCFAYQPLQAQQTDQKLKLMYHRIKNETVQSSVACFENFISFLPDNPAPFFLQKKIYFHALGNYQAVHGFDSQKIELIPGLVRYGVDGSIKACFLLIGKDAPAMDVGSFFLYKPLLQAILKSKPAETESRLQGGYVVQSLLYSLHNITIPQNYQEKDNSFEGIEDHCLAIDLPFDELPPFIKEPIEKRYAEQHNKDTQ